MSRSEASLSCPEAQVATAPKRHMLFISYDFPPCTAPGALSCAETARYLPLYGWEPVVLTAKERYYTAIDHRRQPPVPVIRTRVLPHPLAVYERVKSLLRRGELAWIGIDSLASRARGETVDPAATGVRDIVLSYLGVPDKNTGWIPPAVIAGVQACRRLGIRRLMSSGPCWTNHLVGLLTSRMTGLPWIAHFRDPWTHNPGSKADSDRSRRLQAALERMVVTAADRVVCVTDRHTELLRRIYADLRTDKFLTIPNGYDGASWRDAAPAGLDEPGGMAETFVVTYAGSLDEERTPEPVFGAACRLIDRGDLDIERLQFDFMGWCETVKGRRLEEIAVEYGLEKCLRVEGALTKAETFRRLAQSELLLLLAEELTLQVPSKAYEYLSAARPVLALTPREGAVADLFGKTGGGWVVERTDHQGIEAALREAYLGWRNGRRARLPDQTVVSRFDRARLAGQIAEVLDSVGARVRSS
jgi:glycosyltransferase involved in cell wall biosynthesis